MDIKQEELINLIRGELKEVLGMDQEYERSQLAAKVRDLLDEYTGEDLEAAMDALNAVRAMLSAEMEEYDDTEPPEEPGRAGVVRSVLGRTNEGAQWGGFTGGAAPLDEPSQDSGPIPPDQLRKMWEIYMEMGMSPEEILQTPEFVEAGVTDPGQYVTTSEEKSRHARELAKNMKKGYSPQAAVTAIPGHEESDKAYWNDRNKKSKNEGSCGDIKRHFKLK